jgi:hypothetical protein
MHEDDDNDRLETARARCKKNDFFFIKLRLFCKKLKVVSFFLLISFECN